MAQTANTEDKANDKKEDFEHLFKYLAGTSSSRKTLCGLYAGFSLSSLIFIISISQNLDVFQSNGMVLLLISAFFLFIFASRDFYKIEEKTYRIVISKKNTFEKFQYLSDLDLKNKIAGKKLSGGQIILLATALFFGLAFIWPFWILIGI